MNRYLLKIATSKPLAVIVKGNPKYLNDPAVKPMADALYTDLANRVASKGFRVKFDAGKPYTSPDENAEVWIGHSRGLDRLDFAPPNIKTVYLTTNDTHHVHGDADRTGRDPAHYQLSAGDYEALDSLVPSKVSAVTKNSLNPRNAGVFLDKGSEEELNKWLIAVTLISRPIQSSIALKAAKQLSSEGITNPEAVQKTGYDGLVKALGRGHYVRFDFSMADTLLAQAEHLKAKYGTLKNLIDNHGLDKIREEIQTFKGVGPKASEIFVTGLKPHLAKYQGPAESVPLTPVDEDKKRLREILVNSSRKGLFNPYSTSQYDWSKYKEERDSEGKLVKYHVFDKSTGQYAELHHPDIRKYKLRDTE